MAEKADVEIRDDRERGELVAYEGGEPVGSIAYFVIVPDPGALVAVHTVVPSEHGGRGIAGALVREFYALAGREGVPVVPLCPYAAKWAQRHPGEAPEASAELVQEAKRQLGDHPELL
ncbi:MULTISPECIES: GNAT family N-acetyltransferase [Streptomyces]|uniref:N-acetyltransferase n=2 Tax=Streptomyces TaxID=1883 RepID=A0A1V0UKF3_STRVN|nr:MULTISPECIES: GNAT family N-acetyltransferase [Streptomyces]ARF65566.1 N-acetyltransferase [Streptomyces violaceoruber]MBD3551991.1 N-acetyltransferase [Streptomyces sp. SP18CM02]QRV31449.1 N-acetyltransferase [Streptomyces californicus]QRV32941.1 N-acetyltransferase [Streptomyces californicus]QRV44866.1 N-acetyltransferase [Streptomyces californicus]